jgi:ABC-type branched-subunit amino acid transport system ATPase component
MAPLLELKDVHTYYGSVHALRGISLKVEEGEIVTLIGSNGAGKTTTLRTISGLERARSGSITLKGKSIEAAEPHDIVRLGVGHSPEGRRVFARMSVRENLEMGAFLRKPGPDVQKDSRGTAVLLVEQNAMMALGIAKRGYILQIGEVTLEDSCDKLAKNPKVREAYLGV